MLPYPNAAPHTSPHRNTQDKPIHPLQQNKLFYKLITTLATKAFMARMNTLHSAGHLIALLFACSLPSRSTSEELSDNFATAQHSRDQPHPLHHSAHNFHTAADFAKQSEILNRLDVRFELTEEQNNSGRNGRTAMSSISQETVLPEFPIRADQKRSVTRESFRCYAAACTPTSIRDVQKCVMERQRPPFPLPPPPRTEMNTTDWERLGNLNEMPEMSELVRKMYCIGFRALPESHKRGETCCNMLDDRSLLTTGVAFEMERVLDSDFPKEFRHKVYLPRTGNVGGVSGRFRFPTITQVEVLSSRMGRRLIIRDALRNIPKSARGFHSIFDLARTRVLQRGRTRWLITFRFKPDFDKELP